MAPKFTDIAFTPSVKALQEHYGSRSMYERVEAMDQTNDTLSPAMVEFIQERDGFYLGTVSASGWPYVQFRGGAPGFLRVLDERTLGFADFNGNSQYLTTGNLADNDRVFLFLMDYAHRRRLKIWGRATVEYDRPDLLEQLQVPGYPATSQRAIVIAIEAWDWNCPQHIPHKYSEQEVLAMVEPLGDRIRNLEAQLARRK